MDKRHSHISHPAGILDIKNPVVRNILFIIPGGRIDRVELDRINKLNISISKEFDSIDMLGFESEQRGWMKIIPDFIHNSVPFQLLSMLKSFYQKAVDYDLIHIFHTDKSSFLRDVLPFMILGKFFGKKVILDNRNRSGFDRWHRMSYLFKRCLRIADKVLVMSDFQKQAASELGIKSDYVPTAVDMSLSKARVIKQVQPKILVNVGESKFTNLNCVVKAYGMIKQKYPRTELVICGRKIKNGFADIPGISFYDKKDYQKLLNDADIFVNSSRYDFLEPSVLEAMAYGFPVVSSPITMIGRLENRKNILFFRYNDSNNLADLLLELVENDELTEKISLSAGLTAKDFDWVRIKREWLSIYFN